MLRDVTERHRREENYRRLYEEAQRAVAARDDVLSFVSHDLGNPLAAIRVSTAVLLKHVDPAGTDMRHIAGIREAGLGLSIVQALMRAHGGRAWAESRPRAGSTFHIALPAVANDV